MMGRWERVLLVLVGAAVMACAWWMLRPPENARADIRVVLTVRSNTTDTYHLFHDTSGAGYSEQLMAHGGAYPSDVPVDVEFRLPLVERIHGLRLDPGNLPGPVDLIGLRISGPYRTIAWDHKDLAERFAPMHDIDTLRTQLLEDGWRVHCTGTDPYLATRADLSGELRATISPRRPGFGSLVKSASLAALAMLVLRLLLRWARLMRGGPGIPWRRLLSWSTLVLAIAALAVHLLTSSLVARITTSERPVQVLVAGTFRNTDEAQVYYADRPGGYSKERYVKHELPGSPRPQLLRFTLPVDSAIRHLRFDPGSMQDTVWIDSLCLLTGPQRIRLGPAEIKDLLEPNEQVVSAEVVDGRLRLAMKGGDPYLNTREDLTPRLAALRRDTDSGILPTAAGLIAVLFFLFGSGRDLAERLRERTGGRTDTLLAALFSVAIATPVLVMMTGMDPVLRNTEKRELAKSPRFGLERLAKYPTEFNVYFDENFGLRKLLFRWNAIAHVYALHTSPLPHRVFFGKDDWMFYVRDGAMEQYQDLCNFPEEKAERIARNLVARRDWLRAQGIHYILMIPPEKSTIYPEKLPSRIHRFGLPSCLDQFLEHLRTHTDLDVVDVRDELRAMKKERDVYYTTDIHWNPVGGYVGYRKLMEHIGKHLPSAGKPVPFQTYTIRPDTNDGGDLALQIGMNDLLPRISPMMAPAKKPRAERIPPVAYEGSAFFKYQPVIDQVADTTKPRLLMWRDSFAVYMIPHLSEHFSRSVYIWTPIFLHQIVEKEHPDVVVQEIMELFLNDLEQDDLPLPPFPPAAAGGAAP